MDFNVNFKGKSESFSGIKAGVKKENMDRKFYNVFDYIDTDKNGIMSDKEIQTFLQKLQDSAKGWNSEKLSKREARKFLKENGLYTEQFNESTLFEMLNLLSNESEKIKSTNMTDKAFVIVYKNDEEETIYNDIQNNNVKREIKNCKDGVEEIKYFNESNKQLGSKKTNEKEGIEEFYDGENKLNKKIIQKDGNMKIYTLKEDKSELFLSKNLTTDSKIVYKEDGSYVETKNDGTQIEGNPDGSTKTTSADNKTITEVNKERTVVTNILSDNSKKVITTMKNGAQSSVAEVFVGDKKISQTVDDFTVNYDSDLNTKGVIVQNGESPALVAKRFNCDLKKLLEVNKSKVKGSGNNRYFLVGEEIVIPREIGAKEFQSLQANRGGKADEIGKYEAYIEEHDSIEADKFNELNQQAQQEVAELNAKDAEAKKTAKTSARFTKEEMVNNGRYVYQALAGKTSYEDKQKVIRIINRLDKDYVIDFLNGYNTKRNEQSIKADNIIKQITTEYGWSDKQRISAVSKIVTSVIEYLKQNDSKNTYIKMLSDAFKSYKADSKNKKLATEMDSYIDTVLSMIKTPPINSLMQDSSMLESILPQNQMMDSKVIEALMPEE